MDAFDSIIGMENEKLELRRIADVINNPDKYQRFGVHTPSGVLIYGSYGSGKSIMAEVFIKACNIPCFRCNSDKPYRERLREITPTFEKAAQNSPAIVFIDDMDKFCKEKKHRSTTAMVIIQSCLDQFKDKGILFVTTSTFNIAGSTIRYGRIDKTIELPVLNYDNKKEIIKKQLENYLEYDEKEISAITRIMAPFSFSSIDRNFNDIRAEACYQGVNLTYDFIKDTILKLGFKGGNDHNKEIEARRTSAYYEAGISLVSELLMPDSINIVSIDNDDPTVEYGYIHNNSAALKKNTTDDLYHRLQALLGGKAALETALGTVFMNDSFTHMDIYSIAENICNSSLINPEISVFQHRCHRSNHAEESDCKYTKVSDGYKAFIIEKAYLETKKLLTDHRKELDEIATLLINKGVITYIDIQKVIKNNFNIEKVLNGPNMTHSY